MNPFPPFDNSPLTDFTDATARTKFVAAVAAIEKTFPIQVPVIINGQSRATGNSLPRHCPSDTRKLIATVTLATKADADAAVQKSFAAWPAWRDRPLLDRAKILDKLADILTRDRFDLAAIQAFEVAKPWREADADVAEAIDFCRYYARQAMTELAPRKQGNVAGENNMLSYEGRGPAVVIAPWNFPLAILAGMAVAALVAGNPVIMKPAEQSSAIAYGLYQRMIEAGFPKDAVHFLPGLGEEVGAALVDHPLVAMIAFTGSMSVGLAITRQAANTHVDLHQPQVKRVVCEMGGKNAIIIDDDADLDEAVTGVMKSAFGFSGQKCSACSRVLAVGDIYEPFIHRLAEACKSLNIAPAHDPACQMGPVVDDEAAARLKAVIQNPGQGVKPVFVGAPKEGGYYVPPAVFSVTDPHHPLMQRELFGPVIAVIKVDSFEKAIDTAVDVPFALTGAVFSRSPSHMDLARQKFRVGNLYLARGSTGAMVDRQPFGGFRMSGIGTKSGGPGYLLNFVDPRVVTENTMRHGMTPDLIN